MAVRDTLGCCARRFRAYRRPLGKYSPFVRRETHSLVSLQVTAGQEVPPLQGIPPEKSPRRQLARRLAAAGFRREEGVFILSTVAAAVNGLLTVGISHARFPSGNRPSSIGMRHGAIVTSPEGKLL